MVIIVQSSWSHCIGSGGTVLPPVLRSFQFHLSQLRHPTSLLPLPLTLCHSPPAFAHHCTHTSWQVYAPFLHSTLSRDPSKLISTNDAKIFGVGGMPTQLPQDFFWLSVPAPRRGWSAMGWVQFWGYILSATAALLPLEGCECHGFSGLWFRLRRRGLLPSS